MNHPFLRLGIGKSGAAFTSSKDFAIPLPLLAGLVELSDSDTCEALNLIIISPETEALSEKQKQPVKMTVAWLAADGAGCVSPYQIFLAEELKVMAVFTNDTALQMKGETPLYRVANYPCATSSLSSPQEKKFPIGLVGAGFHFGAEPDPHYPWRAAVAEPVMKTFPCLSFLGKDAEKARAYRAQCQLSLLCGGIEGRMRPEFLEIMFDGSILVTEKSAVLDKLGFLDGENCFFVTPSEVVSKCAEWLSKPSLLEKVKKAGSRLAQNILYDSGGEILRSWWLASQKDHRFITELGMNHRTRRFCNLQFSRRR